MPRGARYIFQDLTGETFDDELTRFALTWINGQGRSPKIPTIDAQHFVEDVTGLVLYREGQFQVQLFIFSPNSFVPPHVHPNVDSYEIFLRGIEVVHRGNVVIPMDIAEKDRRGCPMLQGDMLRVKPTDYHGGKVSPTGGVLISIQHWLNGVKPSSVGNDWEGQTMGPVHDGMLAT